MSHGIGSFLPCHPGPEPEALNDGLRVENGNTQLDLEQTDKEAISTSASLVHT